MGPLFGPPSPGLGPPAVARRRKIAQKTAYAGEASRLVKIATAGVFDLAVEPLDRQPVAQRGSRAARQRHALADLGNGEPLGGAGGPVDAHGDGAAPLTEAERHGRVLRGQITAVGTHTADLWRRPCALDVDQRAESQTVGGAVVEPHLQP